MFIADHVLSSIRLRSSTGTATDFTVSIRTRLHQNEINRETDLETFRKRHTTLRKICMYKCINVASDYEIIINERRKNCSLNCWRLDETTQSSLGARVRLLVE